MKALAWSGDMERIFGRLGEFGYDGAELFVRDPRELDVEKIKRLLAENGLRAAAVGTGPVVAEDKLFLTHDDAGMRTQAIARAKTVIDFAAALGCQVNVGKFRGNIDGDPRKKTWMDDAMREIAFYAQEKSVFITIEPQNRFGCDNSMTTQQGLAWIRELNVPNMRIMLDVFHMQIEDASTPASFIDAADSLLHVHFADTNRECPGTGGIDFATVLHVLRALNYEAFIAMEIKQTPDSETAAKRAIDYVKTLASFIWK
ncbi:MAG: sugar phosphate isomerase/epimerase [Candidatus Accumulibacter sp.]|jgi:sugar phosphate isomerase/epimerase|nr:sugar phosphate isomerase/epimerase [Accumulibacter sp.]